MLIDLPDANVWLALAQERHVHHRSARHWWLKEAADQVAFCRITMLAFLRISTNPRAVALPLSIEEAWRKYDDICGDQRVLSLTEPKALEDNYRSLTTAPTFKHNLWTDAYLASFALAANCRLVSFDDDFKRFPDLPFLHLTSIPT